MIGVIADSADEGTVQEFFELFKTPWEFFQLHKKYDVVLCADNASFDGVSAKLIIVYSDNRTDFDDPACIEIRKQTDGTFLDIPAGLLPIYGSSVTFRHNGITVLTEHHSREPAAYINQSNDGVVARVGYDLFGEISTLLTNGQPSKNAGVPTLDLHIAILRDLITGCGVPLVEIPPAPDGYPFISCLTHDLDHASIRRHKMDRTIFGFLYRATVGSVLKFGRGRLSLRKLITNCSAAAKLPFVYLGLAKDFWYEFDRYLEFERGRPSTFFVIPFVDEPGRLAVGQAPRHRASRYDVSHIAEKIGSLIAAGCEVGLHGIDAWLKGSRATAEARRISDFSQRATMGVRMHWLYRDGNTFRLLEEAGFSYDSTVGYNETVGYRAGTGQAFKPPDVKHLLELPMNVMDTALFYPSYLDLSADEARDRIVPILDNAVRHGGATTFNWHDRSIAPERLWGDCYLRLLDDLSARGAWFATGSQAVSWFRKRRSAVIDEVTTENGELRVKVVAEKTDALPGLRLRFHPAQPLPECVPLADDGRLRYTDRDFDGRISVRFPATESSIPTSLGLTETL